MPTRSVLSWTDGNNNWACTRYDLLTPVSEIVPALVAVSAAEVNSYVRGALFRNINPVPSPGFGWNEVRWQALLTYVSGVGGDQTQIRIPAPWVDNPGHSPTVTSQADQQDVDPALIPDINADMTALGTSNDGVATAFFQSGIIQPDCGNQSMIDTLGGAVATAYMRVIDHRGAVALIRTFQNVANDTILNDILFHSHGDWVEKWYGLVTAGPAAVFPLSPYNIYDQARFTFVDNDGNQATIAIPAPIPTLFDSTQERIDPTTLDSQSVITACVGKVCSTAGNAVTRYLRGKRYKMKRTV